MIDPNAKRPRPDAGPPAPGTILPPVPDSPGRLGARRTEVIDNLVGDVPKPVLKRMQSILQPFPTGVLEALYDNGVRFNITKKPSATQKAVSKDGLQMLGGYNLVTKKIQFMESTLLGADGPHTVVHELCHALDHMRGERIRKPSSDQSENIRRARAHEVSESHMSGQSHVLYQKYQARGGVEDVAAMRRELRALSDDQKSMPLKATFTSTFDGWGDRPVRYERKDGVETFVIDTVKKEGIKALVIGAGAGLAIAAAGLLVPAVAPVAFAVGGLLAGSALVESAQRLLHKLRSPKTETDIDLTRGAKAHVMQQDERTVITLPEGARPHKGAIWSPYAHRGSKGQENRGVGEYTAEAWSTYLEGGDKAKNLRDRDPEMYALTETRLWEEFNLHP